MSKRDCSLSKPPPPGLGVGGKSSSENGESGAVTAAVTAANGVTASPPMPPEALGEGVCVLEAKKAVFTLTAGASLLLFLLVLLLPLLRAPAPAAVVVLLLLVLARELRLAAARACMTSKLMAFCSVCPTALHTLQAACARGQSISPAAAAAGAPLVAVVALAVAVSKHLRKPSTTRLKMSASRDSLCASTSSVQARSWSIKHCIACSCYMLMQGW
jgi:hypothetical protein